MEYGLVIIWKNKELSYNLIKIDKKTLCFYRNIINLSIIVHIGVFWSKSIYLLSVFTTPVNYFKIIYEVSGRNTWPWIRLRHADDTLVIMSQQNKEEFRQELNQCSSMTTFPAETETTRFTDHSLAAFLHSTHQRCYQKKSDSYNELIPTRPSLEFLIHYQWQLLSKTICWIKCVSQWIYSLLDLWHLRFRTYCPYFCDSNVNACYCKFML